MTALFCRGRFGWKTFDVDPCIKLLEVQKFQRNVVKSDSSRLIKWCFSVTRGLISFMRDAISILTLRENGLSQFQSVDFLHQNLDTPKIGGCFSIDLYRNSDSYFSVTTGVISSSKVLIESLKFLQYCLVKWRIFLNLASEFWLSEESECAKNFDSTADLISYFSVNTGSIPSGGIWIKQLKLFK